MIDCLNNAVGTNGTIDLLDVMKKNFLQYEIERKKICEQK